MDFGIGDFLESLRGGGKDPEKMMKKLAELTGVDEAAVKKHFEQFKEMLEGQFETVATPSKEEIELYNKMTAAKKEAEEAYNKLQTADKLFWSTVETNHKLQGREGLHMDTRTGLIMAKKKEDETGKS